MTGLEINTGEAEAEVEMAKYRVGGNEKLHHFIFNLLLKTQQRLYIYIFLGDARSDAGGQTSTLSNVRIISMATNFLKGFQ